jgi:hypothetical protein
VASQLVVSQVILSSTELVIVSSNFPPKFEAEGRFMAWPPADVSGSRLQSDNVKIEIYESSIFPVLLY